MMSSCYISFLSHPPLPKIRHTSPTLINPSHSHSRSIRLVWGSRTSLKMERRSRVGGGPVCYAGDSATFSTQTLQWVSAISSGCQIPVCGTMNEWLVVEQTSKEVGGKEIRLMTMNLRGSQAGAIISLVIAGYLAFQHFSKAGKLQRAFDQVSVIATLAIICITTVIYLFLF